MRMPLEAVDNSFDIQLLFGVEFWRSTVLMGSEGPRFLGVVGSCRLSRVRILTCCIAVITISVEEVLETLALKSRKLLFGTLDHLPQKSGSPVINPYR